MQKISIHNEKKIKELLEKYGEKAFRYAQIENALYKNFITNFDEMTTLSKEIRELLIKNCFVYSLEVEDIRTDKNEQTTKILFKTNSGEFIESVIMRHLTGRVTLCVSSQAGCPMNCSFCATGKLGFKRNLEVYEILEQIYFAAKFLNDEGNKLRNVVYMGMGEPMLNYENVKESINIINAQKKFDLSKRRVTISTCGIISGIEKFTLDFPQTSLAISLHAPNDEIRQKIMPIAKTYSIADLMKVLDEYVKKTNKKVFYEYVMINGVNDDIKLAHELGKLLEGKLAHVNFIPYNEGNTSTLIESQTPILNSFPLGRGKDGATSPCHSDECQNQLKCKSTFETSPQPSPFEGEGEKQTCSPSTLPRGKGLGDGGINSVTFSPTPRIIIEKFQSILQHYGVVSTIRTTMGDDIDAACGQLASKK